MGANGNTRDVLGSFRFDVELDGMLVAGFSDVQGLESQTEYEEYREGGVNGYTHRFPKGTRFAQIVLRRGFSSSSALWDWYDQTVRGSVTRKSGSIILYRQDGEELCRWNFFEAYPVKWTGPALDARSSDVAIESVELVHNGIKAIFSKK
ncbi:phage tail protein [Cohnella ginsengisoli]|uniref:Phage tail protein n=1 Tax=Cohnella ginsengisoli TaxID=425004 RepID=A0A9X4KCM5_9BACL|nr:MULTISPECIES: phage tail protein [Cohnella]MDG0789522.1 phage tail protein [Cohnella ginsengisoli]SFB16033.1 conserved hypothetical phage tail region protein [Cohnella sp. OV330]